MTPLDALVADYRRAGDPDRATNMAAYMKRRFSFFGIAAPERRTIDRNHTSAWPAPEEGDLLEIMNEAWGHEEREVQYFAVDYLKRHRNRLSPAALDHVAAAIVDRSWWDTVDALAGNVVGDIVLRHPDAQPRVAGWVRSDNLWMRRTALLHQLTFGTDTDARLLFNLCLEQGGDPDFFIRKAIGWALRQYARVAPDAVRAFVADHEAGLSPLSRREATKHLA